MGALNSRRMFMVMDDEDDDDDSRSRIEETSEESEEMDSDSDYSENFVAMLRNLINNGQLESTSGDGWESVGYSGYSLPAPIRKLPRIRSKPNTAILNKSEFSLLTKRDSGVLEPKRRDMRNRNLASMLVNRERGLYRNNNFSTATCCKITNEYVPNEMIKALNNGNSKVFCGIFSPNGNTFLTASQDRHIRLYNSEDCSYNLIKSVRAIDVGWSILDVAFSPDGDNFVYSTWSSSLHMCPVNGNSDQQEPLSLVNTERRFGVFSVVYSADGRELVCGANDGYLYVYDIERKIRSFKISGHELDINSVLFADNSSQIIYSGGDDGLVKVWDRRTLSETRPSPVGTLAGHTGGITFIDSRKDGRHLISNSKDQSIKLWDVRVFSGEDAIKESRLVSTTQVWDYRWNGVPQELFQENKLKGDTSLMTYRGHEVSKTLIRARFSPAETTGQRFIYTGCGCGRVVIYDALTGKMLKTEKKMHRACVRDVSWHPKRNEILSSSWDCLVGVWSLLKSSSVIDKAGEKKLEKPVRRSARLAALRQRRLASSNNSVQ